MKINKYIKNECIVCGIKCDKWIWKEIVNDKLASEWNLSTILRAKFNSRESQFCPNCGNSTRTRILALAILNQFPVKKSRNFKDWTNNVKSKKIKIAEINSCGKLHNFLKNVPNIRYSEYPPGKILPRLYLFLKRVNKEDLLNLSYKDNCFDLVLHSEVLEHIPDIDKAILECKRILKPKGVCIFTVPYIPNRKTIQRTLIDKKTGNILNIKKPSYHGLDKRIDNLVWWEFGYDFLTKYGIKIIHSDLKTMTYIFLLKK